MEEYFKCAHCLLINEYLYESKCCGKIYCSYCLIKLNNKKCTICNNQLAFQKNIWARRMIRSIHLSCIYNCGKKFSIEEMKKHVVNCEMKTYSCKFDNCEFNGGKKQLMEHVTLEHYLPLLVLMENFEAFQDEVDDIGLGVQKKLLLNKLNKSSIDFELNENNEENNNMDNFELSDLRIPSYNISNESNPHHSYDSYNGLPNHNSYLFNNNHINHNRFRNFNYSFDNSNDIN